jgi:hypothetical protein
LVTLKVVMLPHLLPPTLSADWVSNSTRVGLGRRVAKQLIVCCRDQKKNGRNRSINKATKNRQSSATAKRRAGAKGLSSNIDSFCLLQKLSTAISCCAGIAYTKHFFTLKNENSTITGGFKEQNPWGILFPCPFKKGCCIVFTSV